MNSFNKMLAHIKKRTLLERLWELLFVTLKLYKIYNLISVLDKINNKKIVFTSYYGSGYGDNPKYIAEYIISNKLNFDLVWIVKKIHLDIPGNIKQVKYLSFKSLREMSTAKIWIDNCRKVYFPLKKSKQLYIQTWHGSLALKMIEQDARSLPKTYIKQAIKDSEITDLIMSGSRFKSDIFKTKFWYKGEVLNSGTPRIDIFYNPKKTKEAKLKVLQEYHIDLDYKILLYAPTFRQSGTLEVYTMDYSKLQNSVSAKFGGKWIIMTRLHPNLQKISPQLSLPENVINASVFSDMQELLCSADIVITDYSGLMFDFYLLNRPLFLYCIDYDEYILQDRNLYFTLDQLPFSLSKDMDALCDNIRNYNYESYINKIVMFKKTIGLYESGNSCKELFQWINDKLNDK